MKRTDTLLAVLIWIVLTSINYKLGELVLAQKSIAASQRLALGVTMDEATRVVGTVTGRPFEERN